MDTPENDEQVSNDHTDYNLQNSVADDTYKDQRVQYTTILEAAEVTVPPPPPPPPLAPCHATRGSSVRPHCQRMTKKDLVIIGSKVQPDLIEPFERDRERVLLLRSQRGNTRLPPPTPPRTVSLSSRSNVIQAINSRNIPEN